MRAELDARWPQGRDLYSDSVVALDVTRSKWYYQILENDTHDADPAMPPVLFEAKVGGRTAPYLPSGTKRAISSSSIARAVRCCIAWR